MVNSTLSLASSVKIVVRNGRGAIVSDQTFTFRADTTTLDANAVDRERALAARKALAEKNGERHTDRVPAWLRAVMPQRAENNTSAA